MRKAMLLLATLAARKDVGVALILAVAHLAQRLHLLEDGDRPRAQWHAVLLPGPSCARPKPSKASRLFLEFRGIGYAGLGASGGEGGSRASDFLHAFQLHIRPLRGTPTHRLQRVS